MVDTVCHGRLSNNLNCPLLPFDVLVGAKCFKYNSCTLSNSKHLKAIADVQTEHWTKPIFHSSVQYHLQTFLLSCFTDMLCSGPLIYQHQRYLQDKNLCGSLNISHLRKYVKHCESGDYGYPMSLHHSAQCCS